MNGFSNIKNMWIAFELVDDKIVGDNISKSGRWRSWGWVNSFGTGYSERNIASGDNFSQHFVAVREDNAPTLTAMIRFEDKPNIYLKFQ